jgi:uncharacterized membrane protein HdeD (DUF308 family)
LRISETTDKRAWLRILQIAVGTTCIILSVLIIASPKLGNFTLLFLVKITLIILGIERVASTIKASSLKKSSRAIGIGLGLAMIAFSMFGLVNFTLTTKWLILLLGMGLLLNGVARLIDGLKNQGQEGSSRAFHLGAGIISTAAAVLVLANPIAGFILLLLILAIALLTSGIEIFVVGIRGKFKHSPNLHNTTDLKIQDLPIASTNPDNINLVIGEDIANNSARNLSKDGTWFRDAQHRYVLFRGVNFASRSKLPPYLPIAPLIIKNVVDQSDLKKEIELVKPELDLIKKLGFNIIRLLISWKAIEPRPNPNLNEIMSEGREYLTLVTQIIDALYTRDLYVILDFHQDIAHEIYGGDGFPDWALAIDDEHKRPTNPSNLKDKRWQMSYVINKLVRHTLTSFWKNNLTNKEASLKNFPVRTHLEKTIGQTVKFFKSLNNGQGHPAILGIEPFNEPHPAGIPAEQFEATFLYQFYHNVESEVREFDDKMFLFMEPRVDWTMSFQRGGGEKSKSRFGPSPFNIQRTFKFKFIRNVMIEGKINPKQIVSHLPTDSVSLDKLGERGVLSFHYYDPAAIAGSFLKIPDDMYKYMREWPDIFRQLLQAAKERGLVPFLTEFGGVQDAELIREYINLHYMQIESFLLNSTYWNYDLYNTIEGKDNWNLENYSLLGPDRRLRNIDVIARPYPIRSSAEPTLLFFDVESKYATVILEGRVVDAPTILYIPYHFHYSPTFRVWATTSREMEWDKENQLLYWYPEKDQTLNQIIIAKEHIDNSVDLIDSRLPKKARALLEKAMFVTTFS